MARETYNSVEHDQLAGTEVEAEIREFVRRDVMTNRERHPDKESEMAASSINWVQWRNEVRFDLRYDIIQQGVGASWGPIKQLKFNMLWRGRYDPVYQLRDSYSNRNYNRGDFEFPEGKTPRELFVDVGFKGALLGFGRAPRNNPHPINRYFVSSPL